MTHVGVLDLPMRCRCVGHTGALQGKLQSAPSGVAAFMPTHSKTPYITPNMDFPSGKGVVRGRRGSSWKLPCNVALERGRLYIILINRYRPALQSSVARVCPSSPRVSAVVMTLWLAVSSACARPTISVGARKCSSKVASAADQLLAASCGAAEGDFALNDKRLAELAAMLFMVRSTTAHHDRNRRTQTSTLLKHLRCLHTGMERQK